MTHPQVLAVDWNKYDENIVATGSVDKTIRTWDLRRPQSPLCVFAAHAYAVRRLVFSPFRRVACAGRASGARIS